MLSNLKGRYFISLKFLITLWHFLQVLDLKTFENIYGRIYNCFYSSLNLFSLSLILFLCEYCGHVFFIHISEEFMYTQLGIVIDSFVSKHEENTKRRNKEKIS